MNYIDAMRTYFESERNLGFFFVPLGLAALWAAFWAYRHYAGGFRYGVVVPAVVCGLLFVIIGITVGRQATTRLDDFPDRFRADAAALMAEETVRMEKVNAAWAPLKWAWFVVAVVGGLMVAFGGRDWTAALGAILMLFAGVAMVTDVIAERRAGIYAQALLHTSD